MGSFGGLEWLLIIVIILLLFGARKIPELARGISQGIREFRKVSDEEKVESKNENAKDKKNKDKTSGSESKTSSET